MSASVYATRCSFNRYLRDVGERPLAEDELSDVLSQLDSLEERIHDSKHSRTIGLGYEIVGRHMNHHIGNTEYQSLAHATVSAMKSGYAADFPPDNPEFRALVMSIGRVDDLRDRRRRVYLPFRPRFADQAY